jgi:hypothetical protein
MEAYGHTGLVAQATVTIIFLSFVNDVRITSIEISSEGFVLPRYEVKEYNQRYAIIAFSNALPLGVLDIKVGL